MNVLEDCIVFLTWAAWALLFILGKTKVWSFTENDYFISLYGGIWSKFLEINTFKTSKDWIFSKIIKTIKSTGFKDNFKYKGAVSFTGIHYNNSPNTEMQKQNETKIKKLQTKVADSVIFGIHCNIFFNRHQVFLNLQYRQAMRKLSSINFNYTNRLHLVLVVRAYFDKNLNNRRVLAARILDPLKFLIY